VASSYPLVPLLSVSLAWRGQSSSRGRRAAGAQGEARGWLELKAAGARTKVRGVTSRSCKRACEAGQGRHELPGGDAASGDGAKVSSCTASRREQRWVPQLLSPLSRSSRQDLRPRGRLERPGRQWRRLCLASLLEFAARRQRRRLPELSFHARARVTSFKRKLQDALALAQHCSFRTDKALIWRNRCTPDCAIFALK
jgi:hypothetical protein